MELTDKSRRFLSHLGLASGDAYLIGKRAGNTPFTLVDAALTENPTRVDSMQLVDRHDVEQLILAGYLEERTGAAESVNVVFRLSDKGRVLFPKSS